MEIPFFKHKTVLLRPYDLYNDNPYTMKVVFMMKRGCWRSRPIYDLPFIYIMLYVLDMSSYNFAVYGAPSISLFYIRFRPYMCKHFGPWRYSVNAITVNIL